MPYYGQEQENIMNTMIEKLGEVGVAILFMLPAMYTFLGIADKILS